MSDSIFHIFDDHDRRQDRAMERMDAAMTMALESQAVTTEYLARQLRELYALDREQGRELRELRATVRVLGELLVENGVDASTLRYRIEAAIDEAQAKTEEQAKEENLVACNECGKKVPLQRTNITEFGTVCDDCAF